MNNSNYTNIHDIPLGLAIWLVLDEYDHKDITNYISATSIMKPTRHIILEQRLTEEDLDKIDLSELIASRMGTAIHDSVEKAWKSGKLSQRLISLGFPKHKAPLVRVNPTEKDISEDPTIIPCYFEQRAYAKIRGYTIGGKFDMVLDGLLHDIKTTSTYAYINGSKDADYCLQGSIYKYLNPDKITHDFIRIQFIFTDWSKAESLRNPDYPKSRIAYKDIPLMSHDDTHTWLSNKVKEIIKYKSADEKDIPLCSPDDLWLGQTVYKYYSDPKKTTGRSTKNFDNPIEANEYRVSKGKGIVITVPAEPKRCGYCRSYNICTQKDEYFNSEK